MQDAEELKFMLRDAKFACSMRVRLDVIMLIEFLQKNVLSAQNDLAEYVSRCDALEHENKQLKIDLEEADGMLELIREIIQRKKG